VSPDGAGHGLTCRLAVLVVAACGLAWPCICGRWLPVRLPAISLSTLTFECSGQVTVTETRVPEASPAESGR